MEPLWKMKNFKSIEEFLAYEGVVGGAGKERGQSEEREQEQEEKSETCSSKD